VPVHETLAKANAFVMTKEKEYADGLLADLDEYRKLHDIGLEQACLEEITREAKRLSPKDKWDFEEVRICMIVRRRNKK
jgi:hypothetical protein